MRRFRIILITLLTCLSIQWVVFAQQAADQWASFEQGSAVIVTMRTGERFRGDFVESSETHFVLRIGKVETKLARLDIRSVVALRPAIDRYHEMREMIDDNDVDRLLVLIDWLRIEKLYAEALTEIAIVLTAEPGNADAIRLQSLTSQQQELAREQLDRDGIDRTTSSRPGRSPIPSNRPGPGLFPILTEDEVNLVKVYEVELDDPPKLLISHETLQALIQQYGGVADIPSTEALATSFFRQEPAEILNAMFEARARELYTQVRVLELPDSLKQFRDNVNSTWIVNTCGTTTCHGGLDAGDFMLFNRAQNNERSVVTNLLILERFRTSSGSPLINYEFPENSLLLQYALPLKRSPSPHPEVRGFRPAFRSVKSRRYVQAVGWMHSMHRPRPVYPVEYVPPKPADFERSVAPGENQDTEPADR